MKNLILPLLLIMAFTAHAQTAQQDSAHRAYHLLHKKDPKQNNPLRALGLQVVYRGTHASIRPATAKELAAWATTKAGLANGGNSHINTKKVQASVRGIE